MTFFDGFHFIRPLWLLTLLPSAFIVMIIWQAKDPRQAWRGIIEPHLLEALIITSDKRRQLTPVHLISFFLLFTPFVIAGPSWKRIPSPFAEETAALVIVVETTESMTLDDIAPSRIERSAQKIKDLLELRPDTHTSLIAYAGSAHVAMPLTSDTGIVAEFAQSLSPQIMPVKGDSSYEAIMLAEDQLESTKRNGSILLISDGVEENQASLITQNSRFPVHVLSMSGGNTPVSLQDIADSTGGSIIKVSADENDVKLLASRAQRSFGQVMDSTDSQGQWVDSGYLFVPLLALVSLVWGRRGWAIGYQRQTDSSEGVS
jgi:Ca-activated chloride channel homolog